MQCKYIRQLKRKTRFSFAFLSLNRTFELCSKVLTLEKAQIILAFSSLNRTFATNNRRNKMEQRTVLNNAQLSILHLLSTLQTEEEVHELRNVISSYYAKKATEEMDRLWETGQWSQEKNEAILKEHLHITT